MADFEKIRKYILKAEHTGSDGKTYDGNIYSRKSNQSSARGAFQFTRYWNPFITEFGKSKGYNPDEFLTNSDYQEDFFKYYYDNIMTPAVERLKRTTEVPEELDDTKLYLLYHKLGYPELKNTVEQNDLETVKSDISPNEYLRRAGVSTKEEPKPVQTKPVVSMPDTTARVDNTKVVRTLENVQQFQDGGNTKEDLLSPQSQVMESDNTSTGLYIPPTEGQMQQQWEKENLPNINLNDKTNIATGRADQAGFFDDPITMGILTPIAPATLFSKPATSTAGKAGQFVVDAGNPISGFKNINPKTVRANKLHNRLMQSDDLFTPEAQEVTNEIVKIQRKQRAFVNTNDKIKNTITDVIKNPKRTIVMPLLKAHQEGKLNMKNIYYSMQDNLEGDSWAHAFFNMTPQDVNKEISKIISGIPKGGRFSEKSLSTDSFKLLLPKASAMKKDFKVISTNSYNPLNDFGKKGKELKQLYGESKGKEEIIKDVNRYIDRFIRNTGTEIPKAKLINNEVYIPNLIFQRKGGSPLKELKRFKKSGLLGVGSGSYYLTVDHLIDSIVKGNQSDLEIIIDYLTKEEAKPVQTKPIVSMPDTTAREEYQDGGAMGNTTIINEDGVEVPAVRFEKEEPTQKKEVNNKPLSSGTKSIYEIKKPTQTVVYKPRPKTTPITLDKVELGNKPTPILDQLYVPPLQYTPSGYYHPYYGYPDLQKHSEEENLIRRKSTGEAYEMKGRDDLHRLQLYPLK